MIEVKFKLNLRFSLSLKKALNELSNAIKLIKLVLVNSE
jgi:hypothetical protein